MSTNKKLEIENMRLRAAVEGLIAAHELMMEHAPPGVALLANGWLADAIDTLTAALSPATAEGPRAQLAAANDMTLRSEIDAIHDVLTDAGVPLREPDGGRRMLARDRISLLVSERERAARIAETHPLHPSTQTGERQRWLRESIAAAIRATATPAPVVGEGHPDDAQPANIHRDLLVPQRVVDALPPVPVEVCGAVHPMFPASPCASGKGHPLHHHGVTRVGECVRWRDSDVAPSLDALPPSPWDPRASKREGAISPRCTCSFDAVCLYCRQCPAPEKASET